MHASKQNSIYKPPGDTAQVPSGASDELYKTLLFRCRLPLTPIGLLPMSQGDNGILFKKPNTHTVTYSQSIRRNSYLVSVGRAASSSAAAAAWSKYGQAKPGRTVEAAATPPLLYHSHCCAG